MIWKGLGKTSIGEHSVGIRLHVALAWVTISGRRQEGDDNNRGMPPSPRWDEWDEKDGRDGGDGWDNCDKNVAARDRAKRSSAIGAESRIGRGGLVCRGWWVKCAAGGGGDGDCIGG